MDNQEAIAELILITAMKNAEESGISKDRIVEIAEEFQSGDLDD